MAHRLQGIIFDLGDTLLDFGNVDVQAEFEKGARRAYDYLQHLGQPLPSFRRYHRQQFLALRWRYLVSHLRGRDFNALDLIGHLSQRLGHDLTHDQLVELAWQWYEPVSNHATTEPGLQEMLEGFRRGGLKLGLLSNTFVPPQVLDRHLKQENLLDLLAARVYSCELPRRKPHPSAFDMIMERMDLPPTSLMFVGDSFGPDIRGANRVGMISVLKDPTGRRRHWRFTPDHRIRRLLDLPPLVARYTG